MSRDRRLWNLSLVPRPLPRAGAVTANAGDTERRSGMY